MLVLVWFIVPRSRATSRLYFASYIGRLSCYRIEYKIILLTFKVLHGMTPDYLRHSISVLPPSRYNLRRNDDCAALLTFPKIRTKKTLADRSFSCAAPRLCNLLPTTIRSTSSLDIFKIRLKTFLFNRAFN